MSRRLFPRFYLCIALLGIWPVLCLAQSNIQSSISQNSYSGQLWVVAAAGKEQVRFTALGLVRRMRLEILNQAGNQVFDSDYRDGSLLDWSIQNPLPDGLYGCLVTVEDLSGQLSYRRGNLSVKNGDVIFNRLPADAASQATEDVQDQVLILSSGLEPPFIYTGHDGKVGTVGSASGGLSFRVGDLFSGKDVEHMRLTPEGNLGIGVQEPKAKLEVAGLIKAAEGFQFQDGTILKMEGGMPVLVFDSSANRGRAGAGNNGVRGSTASTGKTGTATRTLLFSTGGGINPLDSTLGTAGQIAKFTNATDLGDSVITESGGNIGIGTTDPYTKLDVIGAIRTYTPNENTANFTFKNDSAPSSWQLSSYNVGDLRITEAGIGPRMVIRPTSGNVGIGSVFPAAKLEVVGSIRANPTDENTAGFWLANQSAPSAWQMSTYNSGNLLINEAGVATRMVIASSTGNVGVGTTNPMSKLTVAGDIETSTGFKIAGNAVMSTAGTGNMFVGNTAGQSNTGSYNTFVGDEAGQANAAGSYNSFFGAMAGYANTTASYNSFFGAGAGNATTTGGSNNFFGAGAGYSNTTGDQNNFFGLVAGSLNTTGRHNSFFGDQTGTSNTTGGSNSFFGGAAGYSNATGAENAFVGKDAGRANTTGSDNAIVGFQAGHDNSTGNFNSFMGANAGHSSVGNYNSFFGTQAGLANTGNGNTFVGFSAGEWCTTGQGNAFFGKDSGLSLTSESRITLIGVLSDGATGIDNATAIGHRSKVTQSNSVVLGSIQGVNGASADTNVGIGTTAPTARFQVNNGDIYVGSPGQGIILKSPDGTKCMKLTVDNSGAVVTTLLPCL